VIRNHGKDAISLVLSPTGWQEQITHAYAYLKGPVDRRIKGKTFQTAGHAFSACIRTDIKKRDVIDADR